MSYIKTVTTVANFCRRVKERVARGILPFRFPDSNDSNDLTSRAPVECRELQKSPRGHHVPNSESRISPNWSVAGHIVRPEIKSQRRPSHVAGVIEPISTFCVWTPEAVMNLTTRPINLPTHTLFTSTSILGLGLYVAVFREIPFRRTLGREILVPDVTTPRIADTNTLLGLLSCTMMMPYFLSSYMPIEDNQWLHVSVPIRLLLSFSLCTNVLFRGRKDMSSEGVVEFLTFGVLDLVGALVLGHELGTFSGIVPGRRK